MKSESGRLWLWLCWAGGFRATNYTFAATNYGFEEALKSSILCFCCVYADVAFKEHSEEIPVKMAKNTFNDVFGREVIPLQ